MDYIKVKLDSVAKRPLDEDSVTSEDHNPAHPKHFKKDKTFVKKDIIKKTQSINGRQTRKNSLN